MSDIVVELIDLDTPTAPGRVELHWEFDDYLEEFIHSIMERAVEKWAVVDNDAEASKLVNAKNKKRNRGPSSDTLESCKQAMIEWLDNSQSLQRASELAAIDPKTVLRWIPNVLETFDHERRSKWANLIRALGKDNYLGKFREV